MLLFQRSQKGDDHPAFFVGVQHAARRMTVTKIRDFIEQFAIGICLHDFARQIRGLFVLWFIESAIAFAFGSVANLTAIFIQILPALDNVRRDFERRFQAGEFCWRFPLLFDLAVDHFDDRSGRGRGRGDGRRRREIFGPLCPYYRNHLAII